MSALTEIDMQQRGTADHAVYEPPRIERLGTLAELTQGGTLGISDGLGNAGDTGSA